ncbi:MAG TPA: OmpA family protein [Kofleriaceae bacterium]|nr:OmpA family protein [Kofleriaceae bacterium]
MHRPGRLIAVTAVTALGTLALLAAPAAAEPTQIGGWFGPRIFSSDSTLGYLPDATVHPSLSSTIAFGGRVAHPVYPWLVPELELAFAPTRTTKSMASTADVYWLDPRLHLRLEISPGQRLQPFFVAGGGSPIALSTKHKTLDSGITGSGYVGGGVRFDSLKGFVLRFDARVAFLPGVERLIAAEVDIGFGIELALGGRRARRGGGEVQVAQGGTAEDRDGDGIPDAKDACPDRPEDVDGFQDDDGCPDIDNDLDRVLDIADKCPTVPETYNGFQDDDGCPDTLPPEVENLKGTVEGLLYAEGETMVRDAALPNLQRIAKTMTAHPSIRVVLIGHTDDREAQQFASTDPGAPPPDLAALSADLSRARAEAVKQAITTLGITGPRIDAEGHGAEEPVSDNEKPRGRLANRRVEIKLYVPPSGLTK